MSTDIAILFDYDDTLIDHDLAHEKWPDFTNPHLKMAFNYLIEAEKLEHLAVNDLMIAQKSIRNEMWTAESTDHIAPCLKTLFRKTLDDCNVRLNNITLDDLLIAYNWDPIDGTELFQEVIPTLERLNSNANVKLGIVSNSSVPMWMREIEMRHYGILDYFSECRLSSCDVGYLKLHPAIFEKALQLLDVNANQVVFVGDNYKADIIGAKNAGMRAVWRVRDKNNAQPAPEADGIIDNLDQLFELLKNWF